jgi:zinc transporter, ZIP family
MTSNNSNVAIAMALVVGAGGATAVGAAIVFVPSLVQYANRKTLAASLGLSAGVMTYVSFVEIFRKSVNSFQLVDGYSNDDAYVCATLCFFGGVLLMVVSLPTNSRAMRCLSPR